MDKLSKINNFSELAAALDRYVIEDIKPDHNEMIDLVNTFWKLHEKLGKEINKLTNIDLGAVVYMGKACDAIEIEIEKELYCVKVFQNFDLPETEYPRLDVAFPKLLELAYCQQQIVNSVKEQINILNKAGLGGNSNSGCLSVIVLAIIVTSLTAIFM